MIEIKCSEYEQERLLLNFSTKESTCPFTGLCSELPYYKTGMKCRECLENNVKWTITDEKQKAGEGKLVFTVDDFCEVVAYAAFKYYRPLESTENLQAFYGNAGYASVLISELLNKQYKEDK